ncbi:MAG TPA: hypothetical protein VFB80_15340 [Pirellulaceae bacterium]|nr:hypothetical protein [Pirellulaceae bacterium]
MKLTNKQKIEKLVARMPADISWDEALQRIRLLRSVEIGREQAERGEVIDDEDVEAWLMNDGEEAAPDNLDDQRSRPARKNKAVHRT